MEGLHFGCELSVPPILTGVGRTEAATVGIDDGLFRRRRKKPFESAVEAFLEAYLNMSTALREEGPKMLNLLKAVNVLETNDLILGELWLAEPELASKVKPPAEKIRFTFEITNPAGIAFGFNFFVPEDLQRRWLTKEQQKQKTHVVGTIALQSLFLKLVEAARKWEDAYITTATSGNGNGNGNTFESLRDFGKEFLFAGALGWGPGPSYPDLPPIRFPVLHHGLLMSVTLLLLGSMTVSIVQEAFLKGNPGGARSLKTGEATAEDVFSEISFLGELLYKKALGTAKRPLETNKDRVDALLFNDASMLIQRKHFGLSDELPANALWQGPLSSDDTEALWFASIGPVGSEARKDFTDALIAWFGALRKNAFGAGAKARDAVSDGGFTVARVLDAYPLRPQQERTTADYELELETEADLRGESRLGLELDIGLLMSRPTFQRTILRFVNAYFSLHEEIMSTGPKMLALLNALRFGTSDLHRVREEIWFSTPNMSNTEAGFLFPHTGHALGFDFLLSKRQLREKLVASHLLTKAELKEGIKDGTMTVPEGLSKPTVIEDVLFDTKDIRKRFDAVMKAAREWAGLYGTRATAKKALFKTLKDAGADSEKAWGPSKLFPGPHNGKRGGTAGILMGMVVVFAGYTTMAAVMKAFLDDPEHPARRKAIDSKAATQTQVFTSLDFLGPLLNEPLESKEGTLGLNVVEVARTRDIGVTAAVAKHAGDVGTFGEDGVWRGVVRKKARLRKDTPGTQVAALSPERPPAPLTPLDAPILAFKRNFSFWAKFTMSYTQDVLNNDTDAAQASQSQIINAATSLGLMLDANPLRPDDQELDQAFRVVQPEKEVASYEEIASSADVAAAAAQEADILSSFLGSTSWCSSIPALSSVDTSFVGP